MKINQKYNGSIIGSIFTGSCILLTVTFIIPVISVLPGALLQALIRTVFQLELNTIQIDITLGLLLVLFIGSLAWIISSRKGKELDNGRVVEIMFLEYVILHPLGFYILWVTYLDYSGDGQLLFAAVYSYPVSSLGFVLIGLLLDRMKAKQKRENI